MEVHEGVSLWESAIASRSSSMTSMERDVSIRVKIMNIYNCILDFNDLNYVSQVQGENVEEAMWAWALGLNTANIKGIGEKGKEDILWELPIETPTPIDDMKNVWLFVILPHGKFGTIHVIKVPNRALMQRRKVNAQPTLFTCIFDFRGGVYISQVEEVSVKRAVLKWAKELEVDQVQYLGEILK